MRISDWSSDVCSSDLSSDISPSMKATTALCQHTWQHVSSTPFTDRCWMNSDAEKGGSRERFLPFYFARRRLVWVNKRARLAELGHRGRTALGFRPIVTVHSLTHFRQRDRLTIYT